MRDFDDFDKRANEMHDRFNRHTRAMFKAWLVIAAAFVIGIPLVIAATVYGILWVLREFSIIGS